MDEDDLIATEQIATRTWSDGRAVAKDAAPDGGPALLFVFSGASLSPTASVFSLSDAVTLVGRAPLGGGIKLPRDEAASRLHASLKRDRRGVVLVNESRNGCWVNGVRADDQHKLSDGDLIRFGRSLFVFRAAYPIGGEPDGEDALFRGVSPEAASLRAELRALGKSDARVLLLGETGSGKEVCARALHQHSERRGAFVPVNCASVPRTLAESQLFGHKRGAFTGADRDADGYFQHAHGGTLFLDELGEAPLEVQPKLLRVLDDGQVSRVGETVARAVDVRVVSATNRDLEDDIQRGSFRADLFARLSDLTLRLPPLRDRREDVLPLLSLAFSAPRALELELAEALVLHRWSYNVREVMKVAKELEVRGAGRSMLTLASVADRLAPSAKRHEEVGAEAEREAAPEPSGGARVQPGELPSRDEVRALLQQHRGNVVHVARATGRSRRAVYRWLEQHGLDVEDFREV